MPGFKRRQLSGSEELFRTTGGPGDETGSVELTVEELRWVLEGLQALRFPERSRSRLTIAQFEEVGRLQERLRGYLQEDS
jgi:hypothetical protein